jgi:MoaA/NifB/PqqE/SkfB family radical SAM enzyme
MSYIDPAGKLLKHLDRIAEIQKGNKLTPPVNVEIDLSNRCSLGCEGCHFAYTHTRGPLASLPKPDGTVYTGDLMNTTQIKLILDQLRATGVRSIVWSGGGEPTLHPDFNEIVNYCPLPQGIYTNGGHIDGERARLLKEKFTWIYISLDYADKESYKKHKKVDAFDRVIESVKRLVDAPGNATIGLGFLLWEQNWRDFRNMVSLKDYTGADYVQFRPMVWYDSQNPGKLIEDTDWMNEMIKELEHYPNYSDVIYDLDRFKNYRDWKQHGYKTCWWSRMQTVITPDARVWTCVNRRGMPDDELGNLNDELFVNIWGRHAAKIVDHDCRLMCRGHVPNVALDFLSQHPTGHELFV